MPDIAGPAAAPAAPVQTSAPAAPARNNGGQFSPKDGATGKTPEAVKPVAPGAPPPQEKKPEPFRFKRKIDNEDVDLDESGLEQAWKELKYRRSRQAEVDSGKKEIAELVRLAKEDRKGFFRKFGINPRDAAAEELEEMRKLEQMTPAERDLYEAQQQLDAREKGLKTKEEQIAQQVREQNRARIQAANRDNYEKALGYSVLPHSRAKLFLMTQLQRGQKENGAPPFSPEQLGQAYDSMMLDAFSEMVSSAAAKPEVLARFESLPKLGVASLEKLDGPQLLQALGPALKRKVLEASVAEHRGQQTIPVRNGNAPASPPPREPGRGFDEVELEQRKRELMKTFG